MTQTAHAVTLRGSIATVTEYFGFAINNILYQRGIYPAEAFDAVTKYGMTLMISTDDELNMYLADILQQVSHWVARGACRKLVLLITRPDDGEVLERWVFNVEGAETGAAASQTREQRPEPSALSIDSERWRTSSSEYFNGAGAGNGRGRLSALSTSPAARSGGGGDAGRKSEEAVRKEIQAVMRQITVCTSFLPVLDGPCAFDLLVYTHTDVTAPAGETWELSTPQLIDKGSEVKLRSFNTTFHTVDTTVAYRE